MKTVGLGLHKVNSQVCVLDEAGEVEREVRVGTDRKPLGKVFAKHERMRVLGVRRVKTDRRDARALAEACRTGTFRRAHRCSEGHRRVRAGLTVREALVRTRSRYISIVQAVLRSEGLMDDLTTRLREMEHELVVVSRTDEVVRRLCTVPGAGPVTAATFKAVVEREQKDDESRGIEQPTRPEKEGIGVNETA